MVDKRNAINELSGRSLKSESDKMKNELDTKGLFTAPDIKGKSFEELLELSVRNMSNDVRESSVVLKDSSGSSFQQALAENAKEEDVLKAILETREGASKDLGGRIIGIKDSSEEFRELDNQEIVDKENKKNEEEKTKVENGEKEAPHIVSIERIYPDGTVERIYPPLNEEEKNNDKKMGLEEKSNDNSAKDIVQINDNAIKEGSVENADAAEGASKEEGVVTDKNVKNMNNSARNILAKTGRKTKKETPKKLKDENSASQDNQISAAEIAKKRESSRG